MNTLPQHIDEVVKAAFQAAPATPPADIAVPMKFPWPEIRDYIAVQISTMMAQQSIMVGQNMLDKGAPGVEEEHINSIKRQHHDLSVTLHNLNHVIVQKLNALDSTGPRLILPR